MTRVAALWEVAVADLRRHWHQALLAGVMLAASAGTLATALVLHDQASEPWEAAFDRAHGPHLVVSGGDRTELQRLASHPSVVAAAPVVRSSFATLRVDGRDLLLRVQEDVPTAVDVPVLVDGVAAGPGSLVLESTAAAALGVGVGDTVSLGPAALRPGAPPALDTTAARAALRVGGIARLVTQAPFPATQPALALLAPEDLTALLAGQSAGWTARLRLADPAAADQVAATVAGPGSFVQTWQEQRETALDGVRVQQGVLGSFAVLLLLVAGASIVLLASGRAAASEERVRLLRAIGLTPAEWRVTQHLEQGAVAVTAALLGCAAATVLAPELTARTAGLLGAGTTAPSLPTLLLVVVLTVAAGAVALALGSPRPGRRSAGDRVGRRTGSLGDRLPYAFALALREQTAGRRAALVGAAVLCVSVAAAVACAAMEATLRAEERQPVSSVVPGFVEAGAGTALRPVAYGLLGVLAVLSLAGLTAAIGAEAARARRTDAVLAAVGLDPRAAVRSGALAAGSVATLVGLVGVPAGLLLYRVAYALSNGDTAGAEPPSAAVALAVVAVAVLLVLALRLAVGRSARRGPIAARLRA